MDRFSFRSYVAVVAPLLLAGCSHRDAPAELGAAPAAPSHTVVVHAPEKLTSIETNKRDADGRTVRVACVTCHSLRDGGTIPSAPEDLREFHVGLRFEHGAVACSSCHVAKPGREPALHLADGRELAMADAMLLCAQCHGPQTRDYKRGSHGGMNGHWDLSRGPRLRNHCVDCHDPHVPRFQPSRPVLPPRDRLLGAPSAHDPSSHPSSAPSSAHDQERSSHE